MNLRFYVALTILVICILIAGVYAAESEQMTVELTPWDWFTSQTVDKQWKTVGLITSPLWLSLLTIFGFASTLRKRFNWDDDTTFDRVYLMSMGIGVTWTLCLTPLVNQWLNYPLLGWPFWLMAFIVTPWINHFVFKLIRLVLWAVFEVANAVPEDFQLAGIKIGWLAKPFAIISKGFYRMLTGKSAFKNKEDDKFDDDDDSEHGVITERMLTRVVTDNQPRDYNDPDKTPTPGGS
jgi:hypothetical protein